MNFKAIDILCPKCGLIEDTNTWKCIEVKIYNRSSVEYMRLVCTHCGLDIRIAEKWSCGDDKIKYKFFEIQYHIPIGGFKPKELEIK